MSNTNTQLPASVKAEDIKQTVGDLTKLLDLPPTRIHDTKTCLSRVNGMFDYCSQSGAVPTVELLCCFLGVSRHTLIRWEKEDQTGNGAIITNAKSLINACITELAFKQKINPVYSMFQQKCNFGYTEQPQKTEIFITSCRPPMTKEAIASEYGYINEKPPELPYTADKEPEQ